MDSGILFGVLGLAVGFTIALVIIWQVFATKRDRIRAELSREADYRHLADQAIEAQNAVAAELSELRTKVAAVEKLMRAVE